MVPDNMARLSRERHPNGGRRSAVLVITSPGTPEILDYCHQTAADLTAEHVLGSAAEFAIATGLRESMNKINRLSYSLLCATAHWRLSRSAIPPLAQTDSQIQTIQQQIKQLQTQLNQMKCGPGGA